MSKMEELKGQDEHLSRLQLMVRKYPQFGEFMRKAYDNKVTYQGSMSRMEKVQPDHEKHKAHLVRSLASHIMQEYGIEKLEVTERDGDRPYIKETVIEAKVILFNPMEFEKFLMEYTDDLINFGIITVKEINFPYEHYRFPGEGNV